jgi:serine phosphatase RsbU (regulator of sigma subunit)/pSer/pThr/pTyr-binding forkhead associated (FHA) protein
MDFLIIHPPKGRTFRHRLEEDRLSIGRAPTNHLVLTDPFVSRDHAVIYRDHDGLVIEDFDPKSGTFLNEERISQPTRLLTGDCIRLGKTRLVVNSALATPVSFSDDPPSDQFPATVIPVDSLLTPPVGSLADTALPPAGSDPAEVSGPPGSAWNDIALKAVCPKIARIIFEADRELLFHRPLPVILSRIMDFVQESVDSERGLLLMRENGRLVPKVIRVPATDRDQPISISRAITRQVIEKRESVLTSDALEDIRFLEETRILPQPVRSAMCVPLYNQRKVIGLIYVDHSTPDQFRDEDLFVLTHLAVVAAVKIEHQKMFDDILDARALEQDLERAAEIQRHMLPASPPDIPGYRLAGLSIPCQAVGGDVFDYIPLGGDRYGIGLGDVAGKGLPAAMLMCTFQASMRALAHLDLPPEDLMVRLNHLLYPQIPANRFITFFFGILDPADHTLRCVNAGHDPPLVLRSNGGIDSLQAQEGPIGSFHDIPYQAQTLGFEPGDTLLCFSDGVTDSRDPNGKFFGRDRLLDVARRIRSVPPDDMIEAIGREIETHQRGEGHKDDITTVVLQRDS